MSGAAALLLAAGALIAPLLATAEEYSEDAVKAAYLYRFAGYVDWPGGEHRGRPFVIAVFDAPDIARELRRLVPGHTIHDRAVEVEEVRAIRDLGDPEILYVGAGRTAALYAAASALAPKSTLIVSDQEDGLSAGSVLNFLEIDHRVRFEVSLGAAERAHLRISSELLGVAVRVFGGHRQSREGCESRPVDAAGDCAIRQARELPPGASGGDGAGSR